MPHDKFEWLRRIKFVEREPAVMRLAVDHFSAAAIGRVDGVAAGCRVPGQFLAQVHEVREYRNEVCEYRNALIPECDEVIASIALTEARSRHLCRFFRFLPPTW
jgi:hypothetical protein